MSINLDKNKPLENLFQITKDTLTTAVPDLCRLLKYNEDKIKAIFKMVFSEEKEAYTNIIAQEVQPAQPSIKLVKELDYFIYFTIPLIPPESLTLTKIRNLSKHIEKKQKNTINYSAVTCHRFLKSATCRAILLRMYSLFVLF